MSYANAAATYKQNAVMTASPEKIVKMLYDGALRHLERSRIGLSNESTKQSAEVGDAIGKAMSIVGELRSSLDMEVGGEIAQNLDRLYEYTLDQLSLANLNRVAPPIEHSLQVMRTLKEGWDAIIPN